MARTNPAVSPINPPCTAFREEPAVRYVGEADGGGSGVFPDGVEAARRSGTPSPGAPSKEEPPTRDMVSSSWFSRVMLATGSVVLDG